ncbi:helix-turn-helix domain-containing protein [Streptomyces sp. NPDC048290]|uniref:AraC-like ligand-binding domain-containing protein n=1 Tax=Streptomyces sp. NPDC048290 TaxID=3155811 RepID=UPI003431324B
MLVTEFSTEVVAPPERFDLFTEFTSHSHMLNRMRSSSQSDFRATMGFLSLGELQVAGLSFPHLEVARTAKLIRQSDPGAYLFNCLLGGEGVLSRARHDAGLRVGDLVLLDSGCPYSGEIRAVSDGWSHLTLQFPRELMPLPHKTVQALLGDPMDGRHGVGAVLRRWLTDLQARAGEFTPADVPMLSSVTMDLLVSVLARRLDRESALAPETRRNTLRIRINAYIDRHLADPALTPQTIADAHHISLRHLQQLFAENDTSPAASIRHRRLERCRRDLINPHLSTRPIRAVAARWGFTDPAHFSRLFHAVYGMPPRDCRHQLSQGDTRSMHPA